MNTDENLMFYITYEGNITPVVIKRISQESSFIVFLKSSPISSKSAMKKYNKQGTLQMNLLVNLSAFLPVFMVIKSYVI